VQQILPDLFTLGGMGVGRVYLIDDPDGHTLIDASIAPSGPKILKEVARSGRDPARIRRILVTHAHPDHVGGLPAVRAATGAQVITSAQEQPVVEGRAPIAQPPRESLGPLARLMLPPPTTLPATPVDRVVADGELIAEAMGGLVAVHTPGHAPGHLAFWQPQRRVLFCGDVIFRLPRIGLPFAAFTVDMDENRRSVARLAALGPELVCFGHGVPLRRDAAARLRAFAASVAPAAGSTA
jgi:glyoxylase-like metal-dependent hydrolase (beta-lactamase superfamily II)